VRRQGALVGTVWDAENGGYQTGEASGVGRSHRQRERER
jgi:hypothetical protein